VKLKVHVQDSVPKESLMKTNTILPRSPQSFRGNQISIEMPDRPDSSLSSKEQYYSLFPTKKKKGKSKKSPDKMLVDIQTNFRTENSQYKILQRNQGAGTRSCQIEVDTSAIKWPNLEDAREAHQVKKDNEAPTKVQSFADMVKKQPVVEKKDNFSNEANSEPSASNMGNKKHNKNVYNNNKKLEDRLKLSKNNTAITSILMNKNKHEKAVVNQISASTYGSIGKSDDESKYVMSKVSTNITDEKKSAVVRHELEVEFREPDFYFSSDDDFEVEFNASAAPRPGKNVVNKISAMTFQQIGKTSDNDKYVMKPRSWSSVVGKGLKAPDHNSNLVKSVDIIETKPKGEPTVHDAIRAKMKDKVELTPEEREILRQKRRERRKREKENKKKDKEEERRKDILKPQTSKLRFISSDVLNQVNKPSLPSKDNVGKDKGIKFLDEEYPDLTVGTKSNVIMKKEKVISSEIRDENGKLTSDRESNSEWETEDDCKDDKVVAESEAFEDTKIEVITSSAPLSYSSILRSEKKPEVVKLSPVKTEKKVDEAEKRKVKKKDPIALDLFSALQVKRQQPKKNASVLTGKLKKDPQVKNVRNQLDSSAPSKKRGKEREGGKKKKKTLMKKIILADREKRKLAREDAEKRREDRIKAGISLKPLPRKDDEFDIDLQDKDEDKGETNLSSTIDTEIEGQNNSNIIADISSSEHGKEIKVDESTENIKVQEVDTEPRLEIEMTTEKKALTAIHSRKFRSYCTHLLSPDLDTAISQLLTDLVRFQDKQHAKDPIKAKARRRYVVGLREVAKFLKVKKVSCVILAPDIERVETEGGLDDTVTKLIKDSEVQEVNTVFGLNRRKLGKLCLKKVPVSCIGIMNYQGSDENYKQILALVADLTEDYKSKLAAEIEHITSPCQPPPTRPQSSTSVLSSKAAAFVPSSIAFVGGDVGYYDYYGNYCDYGSYYDNNYYSSGYYYNTGQEFGHPQAHSAQPWQNMLDILKK